MTSHPDLQTRMRRHVPACAFWLAAAAVLSGCSVIAVADAAVTVGATAVKAGAAVVNTTIDIAEAGVRKMTHDEKKDD